MKLSMIAAIAALTGVSACVKPPLTSAVCDSLAAPVQALTSGLTSHPETADAVGDPAVDIIVIHSSGCQRT